MVHSECTLWCFVWQRREEQALGKGHRRGREGHRALTHLHSVLAEHWPDSHRHRHDGPSVHVHWAIDGWQVSLPRWSNLRNEVINSVASPGRGGPFPGELVS